MPVTTYRGLALNDRVAKINATGDGQAFEASFEYRLRVLRPAIYSVCWRRPTTTTEQDDNAFRTEVGLLELEGPDSGQERACPRGEPCALDDVEGANLEEIDQIMLVFECGTSVTVAAAPNNGKAFALSVQGVWNKYSFGDDFMHSEAGIYRLCWCRNGGSRIDSNSPSAKNNDQVPAGELPTEATPTRPIANLIDAGVDVTVDVFNCVFPTVMH